MPAVDPRPPCSDEDCPERAEVLVSRTSRSRLVPVCDRHAHVAVLTAERYGVPVVLQGLAGVRSSAVVG